MIDRGSLLISTCSRLMREIPSIDCLRHLFQQQHIRKLNPTMNPETKTEIRRLQHRVNELIKTTSNDSKNHGRLTISPNILHEIAIPITQLNISQKQIEDGAKQSQFQIVEHVTRSTFNQKACQHKGELDADIVQASLKINGLADNAATNLINLPHRVLSPASQHSICDKIVNNQKIML